MLTGAPRRSDCAREQSDGLHPVEIVLSMSLDALGDK
jgi:hypothetical protein